MVYHTTLQKLHLCLILKKCLVHSIFHIRRCPPSLRIHYAHVCTETRRTFTLVQSLLTKKKNLQGCLITFRCYPPNPFSCKIVGFFLSLWIVFFTLFLCKKIFTIPSPRLKDHPTKSVRNPDQNSIF